MVSKITKHKTMKRKTIKRKTIKRKTMKHNSSSHKEKIHLVKYAKIPYMIHKVTILSTNPKKTAAQVKKIFAENINYISIPDPALRKRKASWLRFPSTGEEIHFISPPIKYQSHIINAILFGREYRSFNNQFTKENHIGITVPDLTPIVKTVSKYNMVFALRLRGDGLFQLYVKLDNCLDYLEIDSIKYNAQEGKVIAERFQSKY